VSFTVYRDSMDDWFCLWLKGEKDEDAKKRQQYDRWQELPKKTGSHDCESGS
jgi:hypothetical protein